MENIYTVIITAITTLGGVNAWRYFEKRATHKEDDERYIRLDCQTRITKLEILLEKSSAEKDEMRDIIINLTATVARLETEVKYLMEDKQKG
jgi:predicted negative regulator of RcsB-dependent stress response